MEKDNFIKAHISEDNDILVSRVVVSDSVFYERIKFIFPEGWNGYAKTAVFRNGDNTLSVILNSDSDLCTGVDECYIPHEVIKSPEFTVSVFGVLGNSRATTPKATVRVVKSGYAEGDEPLDPTPSVYEQLLNSTKAAYIGDDGYWYEFDKNVGDFVKTEHRAVAEDSEAKFFPELTELRLSDETPTGIFILKAGSTLSYINAYQSDGTKLTSFSTDPYKTRTDTLICISPITNAKTSIPFANMKHFGLRVYMLAAITQLRSPKEMFGYLEYWKKPVSNTQSGQTTHTGEVIFYEYANKADIDTAITDSVDQTYSAESEKAQSGKAVAEAVTNTVGSINAVLATVLSGGYSTTAEYLAGLKTQQAQLAENLTALGVEADASEPLDGLIAKTLQIPAGDSEELAAIKAILEKAVTVEEEENA